MKKDKAIIIKLYNYKYLCEIYCEKIIENLQINF